MSTPKLDLSQFEKQTKSEWESAAKTALKGKALESIQWKVDEHIKLDPFYTIDEAAIVEKSTSREHNDWLIGEYFDMSDQRISSALLMGALQRGLNAPTLEGIDDFTHTLEHVRLDFITPFFKDVDVKKMIAWYLSQNYNCEQAEGGVYFDHEGIDDAFISDIQAIQSKLPRFYHTHLFISNDHVDIGKELGKDLIRLDKIISKSLANEIHPRVICIVEVSADFVINIAKIRALRWLIEKICLGYKIDPNNFMIEAHASESSLDLQLGLIGASTKATAAVIGGVDRLTITCESMNVQEDESTQRRIVRNIHHILKLESGMDKIVDPTQGSFLIEKLTSEITKRAWGVFLKNKS